MTILRHTFPPALRRPAGRPGLPALAAFAPASARRSRWPGLPALAALALALAGCAVGPDYQRAPVDVPAAYKEAGGPAGAASLPAGSPWKLAQPAEQQPRGQWWRVFGDETLNRLQDRAMQANQDLQAAAARLRQARALHRDARSGLFPQVDVGAGVTRQRQSPASQGLPDDADSSASTLWRAQVGASYEADLFGRVSATVAAAQAGAERSEALFHSVRLALQGDVAASYFLLREMDAEQALYAETVALRRRTLDLVQRRYDEGDISELDLARARSELSAAESESLGVARRRSVAEHALAILLGSTPADFSLPAMPLEHVQIAVPAGLPSALLERRPDIAAAERAMAEANARVGAAQAAFFPRLEISGALGFEAGQAGNLFDWSTRSFLLGPLVGTMLSLPIFDGGRREAGLELARARYEEDVAAYRQAVLGAFREVEDSLANLRILDEQTSAQDAAVDASVRAAGLSHLQYREGSVSYLDVIDADRSVLQRRLLAVQLRGEQARSTVALIRALGGGWDGARHGPAPVAGQAPVAATDPAAAPAAAPGQPAPAPASGAAPAQSASSSG